MNYFLIGQSGRNFKVWHFLAKSRSAKKLQRDKLGIKFQHYDNLTVVKEKELQLFGIKYED